MEWKTLVKEELGPTSGAVPSPQSHWMTCEHWIEITETSEMMCDTCKSFQPGDIRMNNNTENGSFCLNCASDWTRMGMYETDTIHMDEHTQDAKVVARLLNVYNCCISWREIQAEKDVKRFLVTASLAMLSGFQTTNDVIKQVSHRGAIRMPAYMVKGKCRRGLLPPFAVQRENRAERQDDGTFKIRWFYRLLWDGEKVAYHDYMKTVLTKDEVESIFPQTASAEYIGDMFEFLAWNA